MAKKTPNLIDLSIGDPDLITDERIIEQAANDAKNGHT
jgi:aspartate/methionine/tyrosine aminotransferase